MHSQIDLSIENTSHPDAEADRSASMDEAFQFLSTAHHFCYNRTDAFDLVFCRGKREADRVVYYYCANNIGDLHDGIQC